MTFGRLNRWLSVFALLILAGALTACSGTTATTPSATEAPATAAVQEPATPEGTDPALSTPATPGMGQGAMMGHGPAAGPGQDHGPGQGHGPAQGHGQGHGHGQNMAGGQGQGMGGPPEGRGPDNPWRTFHQQPVPAEYADLTNPVPADEASIARGESLYQTQCAACHGPTGLGDGDAGAQLDPPPAPVARTAQMMSDGYLYWRIHDGGIAFGTAMPAYGTVLDENDIWDIINYLRSLEVNPGDEAARQQAMLQDAVAQGVLTQEEADLFQRLHTVLEEYKQAHWDELRAQAGGDPNAMLELMLQALIEQGQITPEEAEAFQDIHQRLHDSGLMP